jgi:hypothetical protein
LYTHYYPHGTREIIISTLGGDRRGSRFVGVSGKIDRATDATSVKIHLKDLTAFSRDNIR